MRSPRGKKSGPQCWDPVGTSGTGHLLKEDTKCAMSAILKKTYKNKRGLQSYHC